MKIQFLNKKILVKDYTAKEGMSLRRYGVNITTDEWDTIKADDNIYNRVLLSLTSEEIYVEDNVDKAEINALARDYQVVDILKSLKLKNTFNRNKPGYGKTMMAIEYCRLMDLKKILVVCPKIAIPQWKAQFAKWWPGVEQYITGVPGNLSAEREIFITNYEQLVPVQKKGAKRKLEKSTWIRCKMFVWDIVIVDESHRIKNAKAPTTCAIKAIPRARSMPLTGTPILGKPYDLWSQLDFMGELYAGTSYTEFIKRFCEIDKTFGLKPVGLTPSKGAQDLLAKCLALFCIGGEDHGITEGRNHIDIPLELDKKGAQYKLYKQITELALDELDEYGIKITNSLSQAVKSEQCTTNPSKLVPGLWGIKFEWIRDWLEDTATQKVVIYSKHVATLEALASYLKTSHAMYHGKMSDKLKAANLEMFKNESSCRLLLATIGSMGTAVDGLQQVCHNAIFIDRDYTPGINDQAESRLDRMLQDQIVNIWSLRVQNTIDEVIEGINNKKEEDLKTLWTRVKQFLQ